MADGYSQLTLESLQTPEGIEQLNRMIRAIYDNIPGDTENVRIFSGYGSPESAITAGIGSIYLRLDGSTNTAVYRKESGTGNTGWVAITAPPTLPLSLANGGTGVALVDPNADRILFWDDSEGSVAFLTPGTGLSISGTTLNAKSLSNVLFEAHGNLEQAGFITDAASLTSTTKLLQYWGAATTGSHEERKILVSKWVKIDGVSTATVYVNFWGTGSGGVTYKCKVDIGGQNGNVTTTRSAPISAGSAWDTFTIDVSGLSNGTVYEVAVILTETGSGGGDNIWLGDIVILGS